MRNEHIIHIDQAQCVGCGLCQRDCPAANILVHSKKAQLIGQDCIKCGHCVAICPQAAVTITGFPPPAAISNADRLDPQALLKALAARRSIRRFTKQQIPADVTAQIIEAGRLTPTGSNAQNVSYVLLSEQMAAAEAAAVRFFRRLLPLARLLSPMARRTTIDDHFFFKKAPQALVVVSPSPVNGALAAANMALMAEASGLGVLYSSFFCTAANHSPALRRQLGLIRGQKAVATLVIGYPAVTYKRTAPKEAALIQRR